MRRIGIAITVGLLGLAFAAAPAQATFHLTMVNEVMLASSGGSTSTQFVELLNNGGSEEQFTPVFGPYKLIVYDPAGHELGRQTLKPSGLRAAAAADKEYLISTPAVDAAFGVTGNERLTVTLPLSAGQVCFAGNEPAPQPVSCLAYGTITNPVATNSFGTGVVHGPVPPNGESDQRQSDGSVVAAPPTPKARNRSGSSTGAGGKPTLSHLSLAGVASRKAKLVFTAHAGHKAPALHKIVVKLPHGLRFVMTKLSGGVTVKGPGGKSRQFSAAVRKGALSVTLSMAATRASVTIAHGAIKVSKGLAARVKSHQTKKLKVVVVVTDAKGHTTRLVSKIAAM